MYDVIIAGASFAGLAVANQLRGFRVLLLDRKPIGTGQTSACGTILRLLEYWGLEEALLKVQNGLEVHTNARDLMFPSPYPWCTFDYATLCDLLYRRSGAEFIQAAVQGIDGNRVHTSAGNYEAQFNVEATGWRATLASNFSSRFRRRRNRMNLGVESILDKPLGHNLNRDTLHFWYDDAILPQGIGWAFPRENSVSVGVGSYGHKGKMLLGLERMTSRLGSTYNSIHGTYFPNKLNHPVAENLFIVGDAAGMCVALTGEGIRPAMFFGEACGQIIRQCLDNERLPDKGLSAYARFVHSHRTFFNIFSAVQWMLTRLPASAVDIIAQMASKESVRSWLFETYWGLTRSWDKAPTHVAS
jgi:flavin-dependent dehydrogenase